MSPTEQVSTNRASPGEEWRDTWAGALVTAVLFAASSVWASTSAAPASARRTVRRGSAIVFMVWVYYAALILFIGAEITRVLARRRGHPLVPAHHARSVQTVRGDLGAGE